MSPVRMFLRTSTRLAWGAWRSVAWATLLSPMVPAIGQEAPPPEEQAGEVAPAEVVVPAAEVPQAGPAESAAPVAPAFPAEQTVPVEQVVPAEQAGQAAPSAQAVETPLIYPQQQAPPVPNDASGELTKKERKRLRKQQQQAQQQAMGVITPAAPSMKDVFTGTVAAVVQASGGALLGGLAQVVTGRLVDWFSNKLGAGPANSYGPNSYGPSAYGSAVPVGQAVMPPPDPGLAPPYDASVAVPGAYPPDAYPPAGYPPAEYPAATYPPAAYPGVAAPAPPADIAAGLAFEVHRLDPSGATELVDPAFHEFHTGERFVVFFRPSLPGRMDIYNINPLGQQALIDTQELAAGQLVRLGPYEFTATTGDEQLRLVMQPCSSPALVSATRDIVRVPDSIPAGAGIGLPGCATLLTRSAGSVVTRDIRKVAVEDGTSFALDRVSAEELASGQVAPREVTIRFRHL